MEEGDSHITRKRPRLDSGDRTRQTMSADRALAALGDANPQELDSPQQGNHTEVSTSSSDVTVAQSSRETPPLQHSSSKVTINTRSPLLPSSSQQSAIAPDPTSGDAHRPEESSAEVSPSKKMENPTDMPTQISEAISISSSPAQSPEIEVAEVEDMDQDSDTTKWTSLANVVKSSNSQEIEVGGEPPWIWETFPLAKHNVGPQKAIDIIAMRIEKGMMSIVRFCAFY